MALQTNTGVATGKSELLAKLVAFLTNSVGWIVLDQGTTSEGAYHIFLSTGENGNEDIYLRYGLISGAIEVRAYGFWDATTHTGYREVFLSGNSKITVQEGSNFSYWFFANKNRVTAVTKVWGNYYCQYSGLLNRFWSDKSTKTKSALSIGTLVTCPVDDASIFVVNQQYLISDGPKIERIKVTAVNATATPQTILVESLKSAYASGAKLGEDLQPVIVSSDQAPGSFTCVTRMDGWSSMYAQSGACGAAHGSLAGYADPELRQGSTILFPWLAALNVWDCNEIRGELDGIYAHGGNATQEQLISDSAGSFRLFNLLGAGWCAIRET